MAFVREVIVDTPTDRESFYRCDCGFSVYAGEDCGCGDCDRYRKENGLPFTKCPACGQPLTETI